jgi:DNA-binding LytR/AlgR family response regulator
METINTNHIQIGSRIKIDANELICLESNMNYTLVYLQNGSKILSSTTLKTIESRLKPYKNFIRINRGNIINIDFIKIDENLNCHLPNKRMVTFSRRRKKIWQELSQKNNF